MTANPHHAKLLKVLRCDRRDYQDWGERLRDEPFGGFLSDCSMGCKFAYKLADDLGLDWVVCGNPLSHRAGLLTFEHQGCDKFEQEPEPEQDDEPEAPEPKIVLALEYAVAMLEEAKNFIRTDTVMGRGTVENMTEVIDQSRAALSATCHVCGACMRGWPHCPDCAGKGAP